MAASLSPLPCSGRGTCAPLSGLQALAAPGGADVPLPPASTYANWEAARQWSCVCDRGFTGPDCSLAFCPHGDSPFTVSQQRRALLLRVDASALGYPPPVPPRIRFFLNGGVSDAIDLNALGSGAACLGALMAGGGVGLDAAGSDCRVAREGELSSLDGLPLPTLLTEVALALAWPSTTRPFFNNLFSHDGAPSLASLGCVPDPTLPPAVAAGIACSAQWLDVDTLEVTPAPGAAGPTTLPLGVRYEVAVLDNDGAFPAQAVVTRVSYGAGAPVSTLIGTMPLGPTPALVGLPGDAVYARWGAAWGFTHAALWRVGSRADAITGAPEAALERPGYREYTVCSGAGSCDMYTGLCACGKGISGVACEQAGVALSTADAPILQVLALAADYAGDVLAIESQRPLGSADFNYLTVSDSSGAAPFFALRGDGLLQGQAFDFARGGALDGGLLAQVSAASAPTATGAPLSVSYGSTSIPPPAGVVAVASDFPLTDPAAPASTLLAVRARSHAASAALTDVFTLRGDGLARVGQGLVVDGPAGLSVSGGVAVGGGGLAVAGGGLSVGGGGTHFVGTPGDPSAPPTHTFVGNLLVNGTITLANGTLTLATRSPGGLIINDMLRVIYDTELNGMLDVFGGVSVHQGGVVVDAGGVEIGNGGLKIATGGISMYQGDVVLTGGALSAQLGGILALNSGATQTARVALAQDGGPAGSTSVTIASFYSGFSAYAGDALYVEAESPRTSVNDYNLLRAFTRPLLGDPGDAGDTLRIDKWGDLYSSSNLLVGTEASATYTAGHVSIVGGDSTSPPNADSQFAGGNVNAVGGDSSFGNGGDARVQGGSGALTGGQAFVTGGFGTGNGGNVLLQPGNSGSGVPGSEGAVIIMDAQGVPRVTVSGVGDILMTPPSGSITSFASAAPIVTSATVLSLTGSVGVLAIGMDGAGGMSGGQVSVVGGSAAQSGQAGSVNIIPGSSAGGGTNGVVAIHSATQLGTTRRWVVQDEATTVWSDAIGQPPALTIRHGVGGPGDSFLSLMGTAFVGGSSSTMGNLFAQGAGSLMGDLAVNGGTFAAGGLSVSATGLYVDAGPTSLGGALLVAAGATVATGGLAVNGGGLDVNSGDTNAQGSLSVFGPRVSVANDVLAGGVVSAGGGLVANGGVVVTGLLQVEGDGIFTGRVTSLDTAPMTLVGGLSVGGGLSVAGYTYMPNTLELGSALLLTTGTQVLGVDTGMYLADASILSLGGALTVNSQSALNGDVALGSKLDVAGLTALASDAYVGGTLYAQGAIQGALSLTLGGPFISTGTMTVTGAVAMSGGAFLSGGELSLTDPAHGITGSPLILRGASQTDAGVDAVGISLYGGDAEDGGGGNILLRPGRKGGDLPVLPGHVVIQNDLGDALLQATTDGLMLAGGTGGLVSASPLLVVAGGFSVASGGTSLMGDAYVGGTLFGGGDASMGGGVSVGGSLVQTSSVGVLSYLGTLGGSGRFDNSMLSVCGPTDWELGGVCYGLFSEDPGYEGTVFQIFWNYDSVPHSVLYGAVANQWLSVPPATMFPVWVLPARRRSLADFPHIQRRR